MKICPICQTTFDGDESFCAHDGTALQPRGAFNPGQLAGSSLDGRVRLDSFLFADHFGERYRAHLLEEDKDVEVTVTHRRLDSSSIETLQKSLASLDWPSALLDIHSVQVATSPRYIIEEAPGVDSLQRRLDKSGPLHWEEAISVTVRLARILEWMADVDLAHRSLHPRFVFHDADTPTLRIGHWLPGLLHADLPPIDESTPAAAVPIYPGFCPPEWLVDDDADIACAHAYLVGAILHTALGQPLLDPSDEPSLHRWADDPPTSDHSFKLPDGAPPALEALAEMLVNPNPDKRFDSPTPAINALSSLIDEDPEVLAPPLQKNGSPPFPANQAPLALADTPEDNPEGNEFVDDEADEEEGPAKTHLGLPTQKSSSDDDDGGLDSSDSNPRVITEEADDNEDASSSGDSRKKTQLMGAVTAADLAAHDDQTDEDEEQTDRGTDTSHQAVDPDDPDDGDDSSDDTDDEHDAEDEKIDRRTDTSHQAVDPDDPDDGDDSSDGADDEHDAEKSASRTEISHQGVDLDEYDNRPTDDNDEPDEPDEDEESKEETSKGSFEVGYVQANSNSTDDFEDPFFSRSTQDAWDQDIYRESRERSERFARLTRIAMVVGGILVVIGAYITIQTDLIFESSTDDAIVQESDDGDELDEADIALLKDRFDRAMDREEYLQPRERSAVEALEQLDGHIDDADYHDLVQRFVDATLTASEEFEDNEQYRAARNLVRTAHRFDESSTLASRLSSLQDEVDRVVEEERQNSPSDSSDAQNDDNDDDRATDGDDEVEDESAQGTPTPPDRAQPDSTNHDQTIAEANDAVQSRDYDHAESLLRQVLDDDPDHAAANAALGNAFFHQGEHRQALTYQQRAVDQRPDNTDYRKQLGILHFRLDDYQQAHDIWEGVVDDDPSDTEAQVLMERAERRLN